MSNGLLIFFVFFANYFFIVPSRALNLTLHTSISGFNSDSQSCVPPFSTQN